MRFVLRREDYRSQQNNALVRFQNMYLPLAPSTGKFLNFFVFFDKENPTGSEVFVQLLSDFNQCFLILQKFENETFIKI